jgi:hypothetical protein
MVGFSSNILFFHNIEKTELDPLIERMDEYMLLYKNIGTPFVSDSEKETIEQPTILPLSTQINNIICLKQPEISIKNIEKHQENPQPNIDTRIKKIQEENRNTINPFLLPKQKDTLFWCLFIAKYGYNEYIQVQRNYGMKELEIKTQVINFIKENPTKLKETNYKITKILMQEIMSELMTSQTDTTMFCFLSILIFFDMNIIMVEDTGHFLLEFFSNTTETVPTFLIQKDKHGKYHIKEEAITADEIHILKEERLCLENFMKPIKPISSYKICEIEVILYKIGVLKEGAVTSKMKKQELYDLMKENVHW